MTRSLAFVERLQDLDDVEAVTDCLLDHAIPFGFGSLAYGDLGMEAAGPGAFFLNRWPQAVLEAYFEQGLGESDFLIPTAERTTEPFSWMDAFQPHSAERGAMALMDNLYQHGWTDGIAVPLHQGSGRVGMVSLPAERLDLSPREMTAIMVMGIMTYLKAQELAAPPKPAVDLTPRETEVMHWVVAGKSDFEIGEILAISQSTTHFHVENAKRKLDSTTRAQAAARAVHLGLVRP